MHDDVKAWLAHWERAIKDRDFDSGRALFHVDASGFGTVTERTHTLDELERDQWRKVWPRTRGFAFDMSDLHAHTSADSTMALVHAPWTSTGVDQSGQTRARAGRCTVVLTRAAPDHPWLCIHTHFSMWPASGDAPLLQS
jgi:ketosteroid isomerase-like protein